MNRQTIPIQIHTMQGQCGQNYTILWLAAFKKKICLRPTNAKKRKMNTTTNRCPEKVTARREQVLIKSLESDRYDWNLYNSLHLICFFMVKEWLFGWRFFCRFILMSERKTFYQIDIAQDDLDQIFCILQREKPQYIAYFRSVKLKVDGIWYKRFNMIYFNHHHQHLERQEEKRRRLNFVITQVERKKMCTKQLNKPALIQCKIK